MKKPEWMNVDDRSATRQNGHIIASKTLDETHRIDIISCVSIQQHIYEIFG